MLPKRHMSPKRVLRFYALSSVPTYGARVRMDTPLSRLGDEHSKSQLESRSRMAASGTDHLRRASAWRLRELTVSAN